MTILVVGINHQTAPLMLRERLHLSGDALRQMLVRLRGGSVREVAMVSTCNRLEIYAETDDAEATMRALSDFMAERAGISRAVLAPYMTSRVDQAAAEHLMRVASGIESLVVGETEVLRQVADALKAAQAAGTVNGTLTRLFQDAIHTGKRARSETAISQHTLSVSHAAVRMAKRQMGDLREAKAVILGAGQMAEQALRALKAEGTTAITIVSRSYSKAAALAIRMDAQVAAWTELNAALQDADLIMATTSAPAPILSAERLMAARSGKPAPLVVLDVSVPRNVEHEVHGLPGVTLYDMDDLQAVVDEHRAKRQAETTAVEAIVREELQTTWGWLTSRNAVETIAALHEQAEALIEAELAHTLQRLPDLNEHERELVTRMARRIGSKLLHAPTMAIKQRAVQGNLRIDLASERDR